MGSQADACRALIAMELLIDNSARIQCTYDVAAAYRLAKADVWVRLPLGAFSFAWIIRFSDGYWSALGDLQRVGKSGDPRASGARDRRFKSDHADFFRE